ncbi:glycosyltransferase family 2 protein [Vibrio echinoideorum]|uniref:glycosyltransferase family 2 protein n=1 Tax=Vibrio echinoideorum TaxID=2100116 RepID=UPI00354B859D
MAENIITKSLIIPVYGNEKNIPHLIPVIEEIAASQGQGFEAIFVIDGSPDKSKELLQESMASVHFTMKIISHSRNFGSFIAIRTGMEHAKGDYLAVMAADLQEPPELIEQFFDVLMNDGTDIVFGQRVGRNDPPFKRFFADSYWALYRKIVQPDIPKGGVDIFGCNKRAKEVILDIKEPNSSLVAQLFWIGYRRTFITYERKKREHGESAWGLRKRVRYMLDSIFSYSDFPIMAVLWVGVFSLLVTTLIGGVTLFGKLFGFIDEPGYTGIVLLILFFGSSILTTQGILGCYLWRAFENTKRRPLSIVSHKEDNIGFEKSKENVK